MRRVRDTALRQIESGLSERQRRLLATLRQGGAEPREVRRQAVVWVLRDRKPAPVLIEIGVADNANTLLIGGDLQEGDDVIVGGGPAPQNQSNSPIRGGAGVRIRG
jgi:HlyD family secretion protein